MARTIHCVHNPQGQRTLIVKYFEIERLGMYQGHILIHTKNFVEEEIDLAKGFVFVRPDWF